MPGRDDVFINGHVYHVFNKTIEGKKIFREDYYGSLFLRTLEYYRSSKAKIGFARLPSLSKEIKDTLFKKINLKKYFKIEILCYCLMPTHFHLLIRQIIDEGIPKYMSDVLNSFTRYYNIRNNRVGPLFLPRFKSVRVKSEEQLKHVSRYIHLNPYSGHIVESLDSIFSYRWSSLKNYTSSFYNNLISTSYIFRLFNHNMKRYRNFIVDNATYQKTLEYIKEQEKLMKEISRRHNNVSDPRGRRFI